MNGIVNVYKEAGFTSFDVVAKLRGMLKIKKIGHTGTLDPDAVGVLPVCVGNATRVVDLLTDRTKEYVAVMRLGVVTNTQDMSGVILSENYETAANLSDSIIREAILSFQGEIDQVPPMYSALKVNGQKLVDLARKGIEVERKPRRVTIFEIEVLGTSEASSGTWNTSNMGNTAGTGNTSNIGNTSGTGNTSNMGNTAFGGKVSGPSSKADDYVIRVVCSKGTYIRTLIHDIGQKLGCGAAMVHLERTRVGEFDKDTALTLGKIQKLVDEANASDKNSNELEKILIPVDIMFSEYPALKVLESGMKALNNGNQLQPEMVENDELCKLELKAKQVYRIYSYDNQFSALYEYHSGWKVLTPVKMFL